MTFLILGQTTEILVSLEFLSYEDRKVGKPEGLIDLLCTTIGLYSHVFHVSSQHHFQAFSGSVIKSVIANQVLLQSIVSVQPVLLLWSSVNPFCGFRVIARRNLAISLSMRLTFFMSLTQALQCHDIVSESLSQGV